MKTIEVEDDTYEWMKDAIAKMRAIYADQNRSDWFDADDMARDVAEVVGDLIEWEEQVL